MNASDQITAMIRTAVPAGVGALATWLAKHAGVHIDSVGAAAVATGLATSVYYSLVSALERWEPAFGILLGKPGPATYTDPVHVAPVAPTRPVAIKDLFPPGTEIKIPDAPPPVPTTWSVTIGPDGTPSVKPAMAPTVATPPIVEGA
jgi:hypothetical protein